MAEMVENLRRHALDRAEYGGVALLVGYAALAFAMYLQYVQPH